MIFHIIDLLLAVLATVLVVVGVPVTVNEFRTRHPERYLTTIAIVIFAYLASRLAYGSVAPILSFFGI